MFEGMREMKEKYDDLYCKYLGQEERAEKTNRNVKIE